MNTDPRVAAYIAKAPPFAQEVLTEARRRVHQALPGVEETIKWNVPFFLLSGKIVASLAAFKKHVKIGVWIGKDPTFQDVTSAAELVPAKEFAAQLLAAAKHSTEAMSSHPAKEPSAKKSPAKEPSAKKSPAKEPLAKKSPAKEPSAKKSPAKKASTIEPAKKSAAKKSAAKKSAAKSRR